jgi:hypothetical protein
MSVTKEEVKVESVKPLEAVEGNVGVVEDDIDDGGAVVEVGREDVDAMEVNDEVEAAEEKVEVAEKARVEEATAGLVELSV